MKKILFSIIAVLSVISLGSMLRAQDLRYVKRQSSIPATCVAGTPNSMPFVYQGDSQLYTCVGGVYVAVATTASGGSVSGLTAGRVVVAASATSLTNYAGFTHDGTTLTVAALKDSGLTSGRVPFATTGGLLTDSSFFTYGSNVLDVGSSSSGGGGGIVRTDEIRIGGYSFARIGFNPGDGAPYYGYNIKNPSGTFQHDSLGNVSAIAFTSAYTYFANDGSAAAGSSTRYAGLIENNSRRWLMGDITGATSPGAQLDIRAGSSSTIGQIIKLAASQSADALQVQDSSGTVLMRISKNGYIGVGVDPTAAIAHFYTTGGTAQLKVERNTGTASTTGATTVIHSNFGYSGGTGADSIWRSDWGFGIQTNLQSGSPTSVLVATSTGNLMLGPTVVQQWSSSGLTSPDSGIARNAAGILEVNNGTAGTYRDLALRYIGIGTTPQANYASYLTYTPNITSGSARGYYATISNAGGLNGSSSIRAADFVATGTGTGTQSGSIHGLAANATWGDTGTLNTSAGSQTSTINSSSGIISNAYGHYVAVTNSSTGSITSAFGLRSVLSNTNASGSVNVGYGVYVDPISNSGTWTTLYAMAVGAQSATVTNQVGLAIGAMTGGTNNTHLLIGTTTIPSGTYGAYIVSSAAAAIPLYIKGAASQSASLSSWLNSSGTVVTDINSGGMLTIGTASSLLDRAIYVKSPGFDTSTALYGITVDYTGPTTATGQLYGVSSRLKTSASAYSVTQLYAFLAGAPSIGAGSSVTAAYGLYIAKQAQTGVTTGYGVFQVDSADLNYFAGTMGIGIAPSSFQLDVNGDIALAHSGSTNKLQISDRAYVGYASNNLVLQGKASKGVTIQVNNDTFGSGTTAVTFDTSGQATFASNIFAGPSTIETFTTTGSAFGATLNYYTDSQTIYRNTGTAANDVTVNVDASASVDLNTRLAVGQAITVVVTITNGGVTAYKVSALNIHSVAQTIKWPGGTAATGNLSAEDWYTFTILKTGASTYYVTGVQTSFK